MTDPASADSTARSPFWRFSVKFYAVPDVAPACIELQDRAGVDVNVLFFLLWNATRQRGFTREQVAQIDRMVEPWRRMTVVPLRTMRRALKAPPAAMAPDAAEAFRTRIKAVELEAERLQQEVLYGQAHQRFPGELAASRIEAARNSIAAYEALLRPFPPAPVETLLAALSRFEPPG